MDPFSWSAGPFLTGYILLGFVFAGIVAVLRSRLGEAPTDGVHYALDPLELAYLSGGFQRAADTVLVGLLASGVGVPDEKKRHVVFEDTRVPLPDMLEPFRDSARGMVTRLEFHNAIHARLKDVRADLVRRGLAPRQADIQRIGWITAGLAAFLALLGGIRIAMAIPLQHPYGFLLMTVMVVIAAGLAMLKRLPTRTRSGTAVLKANRILHARAARAPLNAELALAFALTGAAVLAGRPFAEFIAPPSGGYGGDGGGGCSGGCGGCGGGGG